MKYVLRPGILIIILIIMVKEFNIISFTYSKIISIICQQEEAMTCRMQYNKHQILCLFRKEKTIQKLLSFVTVMLTLLMTSRGKFSLINIKLYFPNCKYPLHQSEKVRIMYEWKEWLIILTTRETFVKEKLILDKHFEILVIKFCILKYL